MKHSNIAIFVPHIGCPHLCSFCDQRTISGAQHAPTGEEVREICARALEEAKSPEDSEIAFFGGSFTAIPRYYMTGLLEAASEFVGKGRFSGIRISTRPDCITAEVLELLRSYGVTSIELGAQSMCDEVLEANGRGHTAQDVVNACGLIRQSGIGLGLQMMTGLYMSTPERDLFTARSIIGLRPDTVRIYPVVVLRGTELAEIFTEHRESFISFDEMVQCAAVIMKEFHAAGISVIKCGLHASEFVERDMVGGYYHPAFRELCESQIYRTAAAELLAGAGIESGSAVIAVNSRCISKAVGQKKANTEYFRQKGISIRFVGSSDVPVYECALQGSE